MNSCTGRSLQSPFLSSLKLILGNSFQVSVIRIEYARYSCEYRIRKASQEYFKTLPSLIFLFLSLNSTVQGVWMCIPQSAVFPSWNLTTLRVFVCVLSFIALFLTALRFLGSAHSAAIFASEASEDSEVREDKKALSVEAQSPDVST